MHLSRVELIINYPLTQGQNAFGCTISLLLRRFLMGRTEENLMELGECIEHSGQVLSLSGGRARVLIQTESACSGCHAKGMCGMHESRPREIEAVVRGGCYEVGDVVRVGVELRRGLYAVLLGYVVPAVLVLTMLFVLLKGVAVSEGISALVSLLFLVCYYFLLYAFRTRVGRRFVFFITSKE